MTNNSLSEKIRDFIFNAHRIKVRGRSIETNIDNINTFQVIL